MADEIRTVTISDELYQRLSARVLDDGLTIDQDAGALLTKQLDNVATASNTLVAALNRDAQERGLTLDDIARAINAIPLGTAPSLESAVS